MIHSLVLIMLLAMSSSVAAQGLLWAKRAGGASSGDAGLGTVVDGLGNSYVTGIFQGTATFGLGEANQTTLTSAGGEDIFVARYDSSGLLQWAKRAGGAGSDRGLGIAMDVLGNVYVTGLFNGTATFGLGETNQTVLTSAGSHEMFVARYDASGLLQWARRGGGTGSDRGAGIAVDGSGNISVTGLFFGSATFGQGQAGQTTLTSAGSDDIFVAQYDATGFLQWARQAGGTGLDQGVSVAVDGSGNSYVTGYFSNAATFGQGQAGQTTLTTAGDRDMFVAKYDATGFLLWAKQAGGTGADRGFSLTADGLGDVYVTGLFNGSATFGLGEANQTTLNSAGGDDVFVAKLDFNGLLQWVTRAGGTGSEGGLGIAVDGLGNSHVTGYFSNAATFGLGEPNQTTLTSAGSRDYYVAKYGFNGLLQWAKGAGSGGTGSDQGLGVAVDGAGAVYTIGYFGDNAAAASATFGLGEVNQTTLTSAGSTDIFLAKYAGSNSSDTMGPSLIITSHTNNQATTLSPITLSGTASDAGFGDSGISSVTVNGVSASGGTASGSGTANWSQSVVLNPGANVITVMARDASSNQNTTTVQITINFSPTVTIVATDDTATEQGPTTGMFTVSRTGGTTTSALTVNYTVSGTATEGSDYFTLSGSAVILTGQSSAQIVVTPIDDGVLGEGNETVIVTLTADPAYTVGAPSSATVTIIDNTNLPTVTIVATDDTATEQGPTTGTFTVSRTGITTSALTVNYTVSGTAAAGTDYQSLPVNVTIGVGQSSAQIVVTPIDDGILGE
ncbi:MAG: SBBP repeat-containing protein, partial [Deltaproteobacteria bacterium]|nr:SBBP repeat-containing protein [Deltaproteobacteria bacterium]